MAKNDFLTGTINCNILLIGKKGTGKSSLLLKINLIVPSKRSLKIMLFLGLGKSLFVLVIFEKVYFYTL